MSSGVGSKGVLSAQERRDNPPCHLHLNQLRRQASNTTRSSSQCCRKRTRLHGLVCGRSQLRFTTMLLAPVPATASVTALFFTQSLYTVCTVTAAGHEYTGMRLLHCFTFFFILTVVMINTRCCPSEQCAFASGGANTTTVSWCNLASDGACSGENC